MLAPGNSRGGGISSGRYLADSVLGYWLVKFGKIVLKCTPLRQKKINKNLTYMGEFLCLDWQQFAVCSDFRPTIVNVQ